MSVVERTETLRERGETADAPALRTRPHLFLVLECERPMARAARFDVGDTDEVIVGRGPKRAWERRRAGGQRQLVVRVPDRWLSALHARFRPSPQGWIVEDAGSTNGSFVNGHRVTRSSIEDGDRIQLGHTFFILRPSVVTPTDAPGEVDLLRDSVPPAFATTLPDLAGDYRLVAKIARSDLSVT